MTVAPQTGDIVRLNSGGPLMMVTRAFKGYLKPNRSEAYRCWWAYCEWIGTNGRPHSASFPVHALTLVRESMGGVPS